MAAEEAGGRSEAGVDCLSQRRRKHSAHWQRRPATAHVIPLSLVAIAK